MSKSKLNARRIVSIGLLMAAFVSAPAGVTAAPPELQEATSQPAFEVASVKLFPKLLNLGFRLDHGNLTTREGLMWLIAWAYNVSVTQVAAPEWVQLQCTDIVAKAAKPVDVDQTRLMLRTLLADRFKLKAHRETVVKDILALTVGKEGPRLKASNSEGRWRRRFDGERLQETYTGITMGEFTEFLAQYYHGAIDRTALTGRYDFTLEYRARQKKSWVDSGSGSLPRE